MRRLRSAGGGSLSGEAGDPIEGGAGQGGHKNVEDGTRVQSFQSILRDLATNTKNTMRAKAAGAATFEMVTELTPLQRRACDLLGFPLTMYPESSQPICTIFA